MLRIERLCYGVEDSGGSREILDAIDLDIGSNRLVVVTGPNGSGKTTLAKIIMGILAPTSGRILYKGGDITGLDVTARARLGISYGFQTPPRFKGLRVRDLLALASGRDTLSHEEGCQFLTRVGLCANDYIEREVDASLSGGELKRIEIATILARESELMIFDEPEAGIDLWSFARLTETFGAIRDSRTATMVIISHQERIISLADDIVILSNGRVKHWGSRAELSSFLPKSGAPDCACLLKGGAL